jgi:hypothetical protein
MLKRILLGAALSWSYSATLGLLFAACASGRLSFSTLRLPGVVPVALVGSTAVSIVITPVAAWSARTGVKNLRIYGPILWIVLAAYVVLSTPNAGANGEIGLICLSIVGTVALGLIPPAN